MKVLLLSRYGRRGASSRVRFYQYLPYLADAGVEVTVLPLVDDSYLDTLYQDGHKDPWALAAGWIRRLRGLLHVARYDIVWLEGELLPWMPAWLEGLLTRFGVRLVVDYDDAIFHRYDLSGNPVVRALLARKIDAVMRSAALVVAGNEYLADRARAAGAARVEILPTVVDLEQYPVSPRSEGEGDFTIGWIGSPTTAAYLDQVREALEVVGAAGGTRVSLVGIEGEPRWSVPVEVRPWSEETESRFIAEFDVGIMPLTDGPWERGKCGYKLVQYMASGRPVIASSVGVNPDLVEHGANGFLADTREEWVESIGRLRADADLRRRMGEAGRELVERRFSVQVTAPILLAMLESCARAAVPGREAEGRRSQRERGTECVNIP